MWCVCVCVCALGAAQTWQHLREGGGGGEASGPKAPAAVASISQVPCPSGFWRRGVLPVDGKCWRFPSQ
eukprot:468862-Prorocentrum_lima.AAC.1